MSNENTARNLLVTIGIGQFNATQVIPYLFTQPATTDPKQPAIILLVKHLQRELNKCGANLRDSGFLDLPTASALTAIVGERWETMPWADTVKAVISAVVNKVRLSESESLGAYQDMGGQPTTWVRGQASGQRGVKALSEMGLFGLPDVPGGVLTYGVAAYLLYRHFSKRKAG